MTLEQLRALALALPETSEEPHFDYTSFRVKGKIFATVPPDGAHAHLFVDDALREQVLATDADRVEPLRWGGKVMGLRVTLAGARTPFVKHLLEAAWKRKAPKRLAAQWTDADNRR